MTLHVRVTARNVQAKLSTQDLAARRRLMPEVLRTAQFICSFHLLLNLCVLALLLLCIVNESAVQGHIATVLQSSLLFDVPIEPMDDFISYRSFFASSAKAQTTPSEYLDRVYTATQDCQQVRFVFFLLLFVVSWKIVFCLAYWKSFAVVSKSFFAMATQLLWVLLFVFVMAAAFAIYGHVLVGSQVSCSCC